MGWKLLICLSLGSWIFLLLFWGKFWQGKQQLEPQQSSLKSYPTIWGIIPARDEAVVIASSLTSLLNQKYSGNFHLVLIDDHSSDRTAEIAQSTAQTLNQSNRLTIIPGQPLPPGWKGKLWAMAQGIEFAQQQIPSPDYFWFTDADIAHQADNLQQLVIKAETENLDLVSLMVLLRCKSKWEKLLIPAFVFFFQKLYPFPWVNNPQKAIAAAAGGCILISQSALTEIGGIAAIKDALIDDCSLAKAVKSQQKPIWLGLTQNVSSLRPYDGLKAIWEMVARTAYSQLNYSWLLLIGTVIAMSVIYLTAPLALITGIITHNWLLIRSATVIWLLMSIAYFPTIRLYNLPLFWTLSLPAIAFLYTLMTIDSAIKYYQGKGGSWKGRTYQ